MELKHYQESVLAKGDRPFALHGTGTGKTLTSLKFIERSQDEMPDKGVVLITSAALKDNLRKEQEKHGIPIDMSKVHIVTHESMSRPLSAKIVQSAVKDGTLIIDEIHKIRNPDSKTYINTMEASMGAKRVLGLTGTGIVNDIDDLSNLYNLVQGDKGSAIRNVYAKEVEKKRGMVDTILRRDPTFTFQVTDKKGLGDRFSSMDVYYPSDKDRSLPSVVERSEDVQMGPIQIAGYKAAERDAIAKNPNMKELAEKIRSGSRLTSTEASRINAFASQTSQAAISSVKHVPGTDDSRKLDKVVSDLVSVMNENPDHKGIIYSNKIGAGLSPLLSRLNKAGLSDKIQMLDGTTKKNTVPDIMENYNSGDKPILVMSDSGAEGLDLKGTRTIQIVNPHFNDGKIRQVIGRGARLGSHDYLPKDQRNISVVHYHSTLPKPMLGKQPLTVDQYMHQMTEGKKKERSAIISVLD